MALSKILGPAGLLVILAVCTPVVEGADCSMNDDCRPAVSCHVESDLYCCPGGVVKAAIAVGPRRSQRLINCTCNYYPSVNGQGKATGMDCHHEPDNLVPADPETDDGGIGMSGKNQTSTGRETDSIPCRDCIISFWDIHRVCPWEGRLFLPCFCCPHRYSVSLVQHTSGHNTSCSCNILPNKEGRSCTYYSDTSTAATLVASLGSMFAVWMSVEVF